MERGIQIKGTDDPDPRMFDTDAVLVSQEEIEEQLGQVKKPRGWGGALWILKVRPTSPLSSVFRSKHKSQHPNHVYSRPLGNID